MAGCLLGPFPSHSVQRPKLPFLGMNKSMTIMQKKKKGVKFHSCGMIYDIEVKGRKKGEREREREREKFTALFNGHRGRQY